MTKNKVFILFRMKLLIITLFFLFIPFLFSANASSLDNNRYTITFTDSSVSGVNNFLTVNMYNRLTNYLPKCDEDFTGPEWTSYPYTTEMPQNVTCLSKNYCSDLDENGELIVQSPGVDEDGNPNCYKKSCLDLTTEELKAIFKRQYGVDADIYYGSGYAATTRQGFYKFCEPYRYINLSFGNNINIPVINISSPIYCHMFGKNELKYVIPEVRGIKDTETGTVDVYQCIMHECPLSTNQSATCPTNFWLFSYKTDNNRYRSDDYIVEYENKLLGGSTINVGSQLLNYCTSTECSKYRVTRWLGCNINIDPQCQTCIQKINTYNCGDCIEEIIKEPSCSGCYSFVKNTSCDDYKGLDNTFKNKTFYSNLLTAFSSYNGAVQTCDIDGACQQTVDCSLEENEDDILCNVSTSPVDEIDPYLSYFYRPYPPLEATEILPVKKEWITSNTLAEHIYSDDYNESEILALAKQDPNLVTNVTVIKRSLRGVPIKPTPSNKTFTRDTKSLTSSFSDINNSDNIADFFNYLGKDTYINDYTNNICIPNDEYFMKYLSRKTYLTSNSQNKWDESEYYYKSFADNRDNGEFIISQKNINTPLCDPNNEKTTRLVNTGRNAFCTRNTKNKDFCSSPRSDSYYIKGKPSFTWKNGTNDIASATVNVCLRRRSINNGQYKILRTIPDGRGGTRLVMSTESYNNLCGARECFISCANENCTELKQTCGDDICVTLTWNDGDNCNIKNLDTYDADNHPSCAKVILYEGTSSQGKPNAIRFRLNRHSKNGKFYVYVDAGNDNCSKFTADDNDRRKNSENFYTRSIENDPIFDTISIKEYIGKIDDKSLIDDNSLTNHDTKPAYISDADIFGEEIYKKNNCDNVDSGICQDMSAEVGEGTGNWVAWDIVQYIGNNQPTNENPSCKVGQLMNCRGYYDANGVFHQEQQGFSAPMSISPDFFYRYATKENSADMFTPLLKIQSVTTYDNNIYTFQNTPEDDKVEVDFFEPNMLVTYGLAELANVELSFKEIEKEYEIQDTKTKYSQNFIIRKTSSSADITQPQACILKVFRSEEDKDSEEYTYAQMVKCVNRRKPDVNSLVIKSSSSYGSYKPHLYAYLINLKTVDKSTATINNSNNDNILSFINKNESTEGKEEKRLFDKSTGILQSYPINVEKSYCSQLHYECIEYQRNLAEKEQIYKTLIAENPTSSNVGTLASTISKIKVSVEICNNIIEPYCNNLTDGILISKELIDTNNTETYNNYYNYLYTYGVNIRECTLNNNCSDALQNIINKVHQDFNNGYITLKNISYPKNYTLNPATNDICVVSGFEDYYPNVLALSSPDEKRVGKCILNTESKLKSECRRVYYTQYCTDNSDSQCFCINGTAECDCSLGNTCIKKYYCGCSDAEGSTSCDNLPEECYLPGYNGYGIVLNNDNKVDTICECEYNTDGIAGTGMEVRKATARELGFCGDLRNIIFCEPIKYYNGEKNYVDGGEGEKLEVIKNKYYGNIWRTNQIQYGQLISNNLEHAEFNKSTYSIDSDYYRLEKVYCIDDRNNGYYYPLPIEDCYNEYQVCLSQEKCETDPTQCFTADECRDNYELCVFNIECEDGYNRIYATEGECNGFWKNKTVQSRENKFYDLNPLAVCQTDGTFRLVDNSGCERYSCPIKSETQSDYVTYDEKNTSIRDETSPNTANFYGKSNGFANWDSYKKGSHDFKNNIILIDGAENGHGDDIEQRTASSCITGYAPAGFKNILQQYYPVPLVNEGSDDDQQNLVIYSNFDMDMFIDNMLLNTEKMVYTEDMLSTLSYDAREHLPVRYCNQVGEWMPVLDIYNRFNVPLYYIGNPIYSDDFVDLDEYSSTTKAKIETNTYGINVDYSQKYCERLFCEALNQDDIISLSQENMDIDINNIEKYDLVLDNTSLNVAYFKNNSDINKFTVWRHTGGATWPETPTSLEGGPVSVIGTCDNESSYHPNNAEFILDSFNYNDNNIKFSSFEKQYDTIFNNNTSDMADPREFNLISNSPAINHPTRECNEYGIWGEITNKCQVVCEPLDPFRTNYSDLNNDGKIQNTEIMGLYKIPHINNNYYVKQGNIKFGDIYTGGARWGRTLAGQYAIGECDSTISYGTQVYKNNMLTTSNENIIFINGSNNNATVPFSYEIGSRPYRECLPDGTWGPVHNPCVLYNDTCGNQKIYNRDLINNPNSIERTELIATLSSSSLVMDDITNNGNQVTEITLETSCDPRYYTGTISQQCNINTQNWSGQLNSSCVLKTCDAYSEIINNIEFVSIPGGAYYMKDTGFTGLITLNNHTYQGYQVNQACPNYYECIDCKDNQVKYSCEYNINTNQAEWKTAGSCKPISCKFEELITYCENTKNCVVDPSTNENNLIEVPNNSPLQSIKQYLNPVVFQSTSSKYDKDSNSFAVGSHIKLLPPQGFVDASTSYAYCNVDSHWYTVADFKPIKCDDSSLINVSDKTWTNIYAGKCADGTQDYNCPGAMKKAVCGTTQSEGKQVATCTENKDGTASWTYEGELQCYEGCSLENVNISFNNVSCLCPTNIPELGYECSTSKTTCVDLVNLNYNLGDTIDHSASIIKTISNVNGIAGITTEVELNCINGAINYRLTDINQIKCNCYNDCTGLISELPCNN